MPSTSGPGRARTAACRRGQRGGRGVKLRRSVSPPESGIDEDRIMNVERSTEVETDIQSTVNEVDKRFAKSFDEEVGDMNFETVIECTLPAKGKQLMESLDEEIGDMDVEHGPNVGKDTRSNVNEEGSCLNNILDERIGDMDVQRVAEVEANVKEDEDDTMGINSLMDVINMFPCKPDPFEGVDILDILKLKGVVLPKPSWWHEELLKIFEDEK